MGGLTLRNSRRRQPRPSGMRGATCPTFALMELRTTISRSSRTPGLPNDINCSSARMCSICSIARNVDVYTRAALKRWREAVDTLEAALGVMLTDHNELASTRGCFQVIEEDGAGDGGQTRDVQLAKLAFYQ